MKLGLPDAIRLSALASLSASAVLAVACSRSGDGEAGGRVLAFRGARVFDGERVIERANVVVRGGTIAAVGPDADIPEGAEVVEAAGKTLLPGLIDAHTHNHDKDRALEQALALGVTTELGMMGDPAVARPRRDEEKKTGASGRAALYFAGWAVTVPGGLGTEDTPVPTLNEGDDAAAFVAKRLAEGSDYVEIMYDDGSAWGAPHATLSAAQLKAVVTAAHAAGRIALVDIASHAEATGAIEAGVDGLAHLYIQGPNPALARRIAGAGSFVMATLPVLFSICDGTRGARLADDDAFAPYLMPSADRALRQSYALFSPGADCQAILAAARELADREVPLLAGTDAGSPGTTHGASLHDGLALLVEAGLTPVQALAAATSAPARAFRLESIGRIAPGRRADLLLVDGDPTREIATTRKIVGVWKAGVAVDRAPQRAAASAARASSHLEPAAAGPIGTFDDDDGDGWQAKSDRVRGGSSQAEVVLNDGGAGGSRGALEVSGTVANGAAPWAGAIRFLAPTPPEPVDLGPLATLRFRTRGDGGTYRVLAFTLRGGPVPVELATFTAGPGWTEESVSLAGLAGRGEAVALLFSAGPAPGRYQFELDEVVLR